MGGGRGRGPGELMAGRKGGGRSGEAYREYGVGRRVGEGRGRGPGG